MLFDLPENCFSKFTASMAYIRTRGETLCLSFLNSRTYSVFEICELFSLLCLIVEPLIVHPAAVKDKTSFYLKWSHSPSLLVKHNPISIVVLLSFLINYEILLKVKLII